MAISGVSCDGFVGGRVPPDRVAHEREQVLGVDPLGFGQEARLGEQLVQRRRVALDDRPLAGELELDRLGSMRLNRPKSRNAMRPSLEQQEVARVRVAGELAVAVEAAEEEAEHDLADAVALGLRAVA